MEKDKITAEMIKKLDSEGYNILLTLMNHIWETQEIPDEWLDTLITPIYKSGDKLECKNYRGINLININIKILEQLIANRIRQKIEHKLQDSQCGFRRGRSAQDHIFIIRQITEKLQHQNKNTYLAFIDLEKAFDSVNREIVYRILEPKPTYNTHQEDI